MMLSFDNVEFHYRNQAVFTNLNMELDYGEFVFVIGKSGIGKSTLMQLIYMNIFPLTGIVRIDDVLDSKSKLSGAVLIGNGKFQGFGIKCDNVELPFFKLFYYDPREIN